MLIMLKEDGSIAIEDPYNFKHFALALADERPHSSAAVDLENGFAWVNAEHLRNFPGLAQDPKWQNGLQGMIAFARGRGWVDLRDRIRAHIEP